VALFSQHGHGPAGEDGLVIEVSVQKRRRSLRIHYGGSWGFVD
jgi:hypothetical protein